MLQQADIGIIGLAVMGKNLSLNFERHGYTVAVYEPIQGKTDRFIEESGKNKNFIGAQSIAELIQALTPPRKVMLMIRSGQPVDDLVSQLLPLLDKGDIIIDGGNSHYQDTKRRVIKTEQKGIWYLGIGVSGGEEGALQGPSLMPGGSEQAWPFVKEMFEAISAKVDQQTPCCSWIGKMGAGHFVKMVHNGIEYGDMQIVCEAYHLMKSLLQLTADEIHTVFQSWKQGDLEGYLIDITADIFAFRDELGEPLIDKILDEAEQKGTGKWVCHTALEQGVPLSMISEAVFVRFLSALKQERLTAQAMLKGCAGEGVKDKQAFLNQLQQALYAAKIISYAQGFSLMRVVSEQESWDLNFGEIALTWRGGCIIRSAFLGKIKDAFDECADLTNLMLNRFFQKQLAKAQTSWRTIVAAAVLNGIPIPAIASALHYYDGYRSDWLPANLLQAQRDYFGAHLFKRHDKPSDQYYHANWADSSK